ncbi:MAG: carbohydrate binding domain-containing protein [Chloroflexota bacterium]
MKKSILVSLLVALILVIIRPGQAAAQADDPTPPGEPVKLIFIHHSTGENWLRDGYGDLGRALAENNYFVSDTNYGWGPDGIGDRTDIPNWIEWFRSERTPDYMAALFGENEQHADYTRSRNDPGGENAIVLFKSCFPNSALEGNPSDAPDAGGWLSVGHAKYVYNEILQYFATRPDKLFVVITAPPLQDGTYAANARAFNDWLQNDWLDDNDYTQNNVAVFDFYNVLTAPDAHHRYADGQIEHVATASNTLAYPSEDDHPSAAGSRKATEEFIPLLNIFYHRWQAGKPHEPTPPGEAAPKATSVPALPTPSIESEQTTATPENDPGLPGEIDGFESALGTSREGWQAYRDEATETRITCAPTTGTAHNGTHALQIDFDVPAEGWATCALYFDESQNWSGAEGITFNLYSAEPAGQAFNVDLYAGSTESPDTYAATVYLPAASAGGWAPIALRWEDFRRVAWEENAGAPFDAHQAVLGIAFGFNALDGAPNTGVLWVDDLQRSSSPAAAGPDVPPTETPGEAAATQAAPTPTAARSETPTSGSGRGSVCGSTLAGPLAVLGAALFTRRRSRRPATAAVLGLAILACSWSAPPSGAPAPALAASPTAGNQTFLPTVACKANPTGERIQPADLTYLGAIRLPDGGERPYTFEYGGNAMTFRPGSDAENDGFPGTLFITGHDRLAYGELPNGSQVAELDIPAPVKGPLDSLDRTAFRQDFTDVAAGRFTGLDEIPRIGMAYLDNPATGPLLHLAWGQHMPPDLAPATHAWVSTNLAAPAFQGEWFIGNQDFNSVNGYLFEIPADWANRHTGGRLLATGRYRDGGWSGMGPALFAYQPWLDSGGTPAASGTRLQESILLRYQSSLDTPHIEGCLNGYQHPDEWEGGAWLTNASGKQAVIFAGTKSTGEKYWYGYTNPAGPQYPCVAGDFVGQYTVCYQADGTPCPPEDLLECSGHNDARGWWSSRMEAQIIFYDPGDLAQVAAGQLAAWQPQPYATLDLEAVLYHNPANVEAEMLGEGVQRRFRIGDVAFDRAGGLLYVLELFADGAKPVVHVWRLAP